MLEIGQKVKNFSLIDSYGVTHKLSDYYGSRVVIYFYPRDNTLGCTVQARVFRDVYNEFKKKEVIVMGISKDSPKSHLKFSDKHQLPFILLSDEDLSVIKYFEVYIEKSMFGKKYMGISRSTFVLDEKGVITHVFEKASPKENALDILKVLK